jgi:hypothetical protein
MTSSASWNCVEPFIMQSRMRNQETKEAVYKSLSVTQKSIYSFYVYYNHASKDIDSFINYTNYYKSIGFLSEISKGASYFNDNDFSDLINILNSNENSLNYHILYEELLREGKRHIDIMDRNVESIL